MTERIQMLMDDAKALFNRYSVDTVVIEWPRFFGSSKGRAVADKGDLGKLYLAASTLFVEAIRFGAVPELVDVNVWKGQLTKAAVMYHVKNRLDVGDRVFHSHEWDAVGLGLSFMGHFVGV